MNEFTCSACFTKIGLQNWDTHPCKAPLSTAPVSKPLNLKTELQLLAAIAESQGELHSLSIARYLLQRMEK